MSNSAEVTDKVALTTSNCSGLNNTCGASDSFVCGPEEWNNGLTINRPSIVESYLSGHAEITAKLTVRPGGDDIYLVFRVIPLGGEKCEDVSDAAVNDELRDTASYLANTDVFALSDLAHKANNMIPSGVWRYSAEALVDRFGEVFFKSPVKVIEVIANREVKIPRVISADFFKTDASNLVEGVPHVVNASACEVSDSVGNDALVESSLKKFVAGVRINFNESFCYAITEKLLSESINLHDVRVCFRKQ